MVNTAGVSLPRKAKCNVGVGWKQYAAYSQCRMLFQILVVTVYAA